MCGGRGGGASGYMDCSNIIMVHSHCPRLTQRLGLTLVVWVQHPMLVSILVQCEHFCIMSLYPFVIKFCVESWGRSWISVNTPLRLIYIRAEATSLLTCCIVSNLCIYTTTTAAATKIKEKNRLRFRPNVDEPLV